MADFVPLREGSVITETVVHLVARRGDAIDPMGTGVVIAPHIVLTAKHVLSDYLRSLDGRELHDGMETRFSLMVIAQDRDGSNAYVFDARAMGLATHTDLALLWISPWSGLPSTFVWQYAGLELRPPAVGSNVACFGYHSCTGGVVDSQVRVVRDMATSTGQVIEVLAERRDFMLDWPCFRVDARFDGGMSGGPVFNEAGLVCGIISSNMPPSSSDEEHVSYATTLWPMLAITTNFPIGGLEPKKRLVEELVRDGTIAAEHWEDVTLERDGSGVIRSLRLKGNTSR